MNGAQLARFDGVFDAHYPEILQRSPNAIVPARAPNARKLRVSAPGDESGHPAFVDSSVEQRTCFHRCRTDRGAPMSARPEPSQADTTSSPREIVIYTRPG
jgi:hypothetical protein